jgi:hypothetical protein
MERTKLEWPSWRKISGAPFSCAIEAGTKKARQINMQGKIETNRDIVNRRVVLLEDPGKLRYSLRGGVTSSSLWVEEEWVD